MMAGGPYSVSSIAARVAGGQEIPGRADLWQERAVITAMFFWGRKLERRNRLFRDAASGVYFLGSKSARTMRANELPAYYADRD